MILINLDIDLYSLLQNPKTREVILHCEASCAHQQSKNRPQLLATVEDLELRKIPIFGTVHKLINDRADTGTFPQTFFLQVDKYKPENEN